MRTVARLSLIFYGALLILVMATPATADLRRAAQYFWPDCTDNRLRLPWLELGATPRAPDGFIPQGIVHINGEIVLAGSRRNERNVNFILRLTKTSYQIVGQFEMPPEAVHTSGLDWDGEYLWAIDYVSQKLYKIDYLRSKESGKALVVGAVDTGLKGAGSVAVATYNDDRYLIVTDFMRTGRSYLVRLEDALKPGSIPKKAKFSYQNGFFNQGIAFSGNYVYEANNNVGINTIYRIDLGKAIDGDDIAAGIVASFEAPGYGVEDLTIQPDGSMLTTDENSLKLYKVDNILTMKLRSKC